MSAPTKFAPRSAEDVARLIETQPLAWIVSSHGSESRATLLPLRAQLDAQGEVGELVGHFARSNDHIGLLRAQPRAQILFLGVHGYISPSWMQDKTQAPTWNYASVQFLADVQFFEEPQQIEAHLRDLVDAMEAGRANAWSVDQMGERYHRLSRGVIGFRARVIEQRARFKLGQDERADVYRDISIGLRDNGGDELLEMMNQFNPGRAGA